MQFSSHELEDKLREKKEAMSTQCIEELVIVGADLSLNYAT
jgi:hypothetical protein